MPWQQDFFPLLVVVAGPGYSGEFAYSPAPGTGNLIASVAASSGTDPYGNAYVAGVISYSTIGGLAVAQGSQNGRIYFATAPSQAGPYVAASGQLRSIGSYLNGFTSGQDVNGNLYPVTVRQVDAGTIELAGRVVIPAGWTSGTPLGSLAAPFRLPPSGSNPPEFATSNATGNATGSIVLRPNGNIAPFSAQWVPSDTLIVAGSFAF